MHAADLQQIHGVRIVGTNWRREIRSVICFLYTFREVLLSMLIQQHLYAPYRTIVLQPAAEKIQQMGLAALKGT